jgi:hypothetical protein
MKLDDLAGKKIGLLDVIDIAERGSDGKPKWNCKCSCGASIVVSHEKLRRKVKYKQSCGCARKHTDLTGMTFYRLVVIGLGERKVLANGSTIKTWRCSCSCGKAVIVLTGDIVSGKTRSCGCYRADTTSARETTHGATRVDRGKPSPTAEYRAWGAMIYRCESESGDRFAYYGGRGIYICKRWRGDFTAFRDDMGPKPSRKHSLDRMNNNGSYTCGKCEECVARGAPANCRWATWQEQARNKRNNVIVTAYGATLTAPEWQEEIGIPAGTIRDRVSRGLSGESAVEFNFRMSDDD